MNEEKQGSLVLQIGGKTRTLYFDYVFLSLMFVDFPADIIDDVFMREVHRTVPRVTYYGLKAGEDENDLPDGFNELSAAKWLREVTANNQAQIMEGYKHSMGFLSIVFRPITTEAIPVKTKSKA